MDIVPEWNDIFGWMGGILALVYNLPQIYVICKTKKVDDLSLHSWVLRLISYTFYIIHVWIRQDAALFYTYLIGFFQCCIITGQICLYKSDCHQTNGTTTETTREPAQPKFRGPDAETSSDDGDV